MSTAAFESLVSSVCNVEHNVANTTITEAAYLTWQHSYVFDALQGLRYGQSFCNHFDITDNILFYERDRPWADNYIQTYYVKHDSGNYTTH